jgi:hypothetical protein
MGEEHRPTQSQGIKYITPSYPNRIIRLHNSAKKKVSGFRELLKTFVYSAPHPSAFPFALIILLLF